MSSRTTQNDVKKGLCLVADELEELIGEKEAVKILFLLICHFCSQRESAKKELAQYSTNTLKGLDFSFATCSDSYAATRSCHRKNLKGFLTPKHSQEKTFSGLLKESGFKDDYDGFSKLGGKNSEKSAMGFEFIQIIFCLSAKLNERSLEKYVVEFIREYPECQSWSKKHKYVTELIKPLIKLDKKSTSLTSISSTDFQIKLELPQKRPNDINYYGTQVINVLGRDKEETQLRAFLNCDGGFAWYQLAGVAGQGKSRLALELVLEYQGKGWNAGLLEEGAIDELGDDGWKTWQPESPHIFVLDYVIGRTDTIRSFFQILASRKEELRHDVRLLLIERQPWEAQTQKRQTEGFLRDMTETRASWYLSLIFDDKSNDISKTRFQSGLFELKEIDEEQLLEITKQVAQSFPDGKILISDSQIKQRLKQIDNSGRPLYAYFLGQELAGGVDTEGWSRSDLLNAALSRERKLWWKAAFKNSKPPSYEKDIPATRLAVLATIIDGFNCEQVDQNQLFLLVDSDTRSEALALTGGYLYSEDDILGASQSIPSIQPDLLGEWYVLKSLELGLPLKELTSIAFKYSENNAVNFIERASQDFNQHPVLKEMVNNIEYDYLEIKTLNIIFVAALNYINEAPPLLITSIEKQIEKANSTGREYVKAMFNFGIFYERGVGVEKDLEQSFIWFEKAAKAGYAPAMRNLADCYVQRHSSEQDLEHAVGWYLKASDAGDPKAMFRLGRFYSQVGGVVQGKLAFDLYQLAADAGDATAMSYLGTCYAEGNGVENDWRQAAVWYQEAAYAGNVTAMYNLASCYARGDGVEESLEKAIYWYHNAAQRGYQPAIEFLSKFEKT